MCKPWFIISLLQYSDLVAPISVTYTEGGNIIDFPEKKGEQAGCNDLWKLAKCLMCQYEYLLSYCWQFLLATALEERVA